MAGTITLTKGLARHARRQVKGVGGLVFGATTTPFSGAETLAFTVWKGDEQVPLATPFAAWVDANTGVYEVDFTAPDTSGLLPARYHFYTTATTAGSTGVIDRGDLELLPAAVTPAAAAVASPSAVAIGNARPRLANAYCTDEDVCCRAPQDFPALCPRDQLKASGTDGVFKSGSPWVLTSASVDFRTAGVGPNDIVLLSRVPSLFKGPLGAAFAVDSVGPNVATLRRVGGYLGEGAPPAPSAGLTGVEFRVPTLRPLIDEVSYDAQQQYNIDEAIPGITTGDLYDRRQLRQWCVLSVLERAYTAATEKADGDYAAKLDLVTRQLGDLRDRMEVRWAPTRNRAAGSLFNMRIGR